MPTEYPTVKGRISLPPVKSWNHKSSGSSMELSGLWRKSVMVLRMIFWSDGPDGG